MFARALPWLGLIGIACSTCSRAEPEREREPAGPAAPSIEAGELVADAPAGETAHGSGETGETGELETGETGERETGELARLCSRPFNVSTTPGKGSQTVEQHEQQTDAERAAARRRLARGLAVRVDERERQAWTSKVGVEFDGLDPTAPHVIDIFDADGDRVRQLSLNFERRGSVDVCLGFNSFYSSWQLRSLRSGARCGPCVMR